MKIKPIYIVLSAVAIGGGLYLMFKKPKADDTTPTPPEDNLGPQNPSDRPKDTKQNSIPSNLEQLLTGNKIKGVNLYTKIDNVNLRTSSSVNNGGINNIYGTLPNKDRLIGSATGKVVLEQGKDRKNPATGKDYRWIQISLSKFAYDKIQTQKSWFSKDLLPTTTYPLIWVRDDVLRLK
jgi:hypothetical protein